MTTCFRSAPVALLLIASLPSCVGQGQGPWHLDDEVAFKFGPVIGQQLLAGKTTIALANTTFSIRDAFIPGCHQRLYEPNCGMRVESRFRETNIAPMRRCDVTGGVVRYGDLSFNVTASDLTPTEVVVFFSGTLDPVCYATK